MPNTPSGASLHRHLLGPHPIIRHYLERMSFRGIIRGSLGAGLQQSLDHAEVLSVLIHNILVSRGPMYRIRQWARRIEPEALGLTASQVSHLNDDRIARSLDALASERGRNVFFRLALRIIKDFEIHTSRVHFDTTTVTFFGQYSTSRADPRITYGVNKDHRPDLKQLLFGLNISSDGAVPLLHHVFSGNRTDDSVHVRNVDLLRSLLGTGEFIYVADSKLCTTKNLEHVSSYGGQFVTVMPRTRKEDRQFRQQLREGEPPVRWRKCHEIPNSRRRTDPPDVYFTTKVGPQKSAEGYRIVWVRSSQKAELDCQARAGRLRKAELELKEIAEKVGTRSLKTAKAVKQKVAKVLSTYKVADFLEARIVPFTEIEYRYLRKGRPRPGDPKRKIRHRRLGLEVTRNKEALRKEARTDGVFPLVTNLERGSKKEILEIYKYQPYVEKRFALTKSEYGIAPIFLKKPIRVVGLIHLYFIAIMLSALLERQLRTAMTAAGIPDLPILPEHRTTRTPTTPRILENFSDVSWHEFREGDRVVTFPVEVNEIQKQLLSLSGVPSSLYR
jgi:transposase